MRIFGLECLINKNCQYYDRFVNNLAENGSVQFVVLGGKNILEENLKNFKNNFKKNPNLKMFHFEEIANSLNKI
jgi:hypothetical protein